MAIILHNIGHYFLLDIVIIVINRYSLLLPLTVAVDHYRLPLEFNLLIYFTAFYKSIGRDFFGIIIDNLFFYLGILWIDLGTTYFIDYVLCISYGISGDMSVYY